MNKKLRKALVILGTIVIFVAMKFAAQEYWLYVNTPFFQTRGVVLFWDDVNKPEKLDWIKLCKDVHLNTISLVHCFLFDSLNRNFFFLCHCVKPPYLEFSRRLSRAV